MIRVYGICDQPDTPVPAPLDGVREGELLAVVRRHTDAPADPSLDTLLEHEHVIEQLMADRAVLPMRFGTALADDDALRAILAERQSEFVAALARVRGRVEIGVRAQAQSPPPPTPAASGRAYLESKLRSGREAAAVHEPLAALAAASTRQAVRRPDELLRASYLVDSAAVGRFQEAVERVQQADPGVAILCTGPWPPYSFVA